MRSSFVAVAVFMLLFPLVAQVEAQTTPSEALLKEWDIFAATGGNWDATQNVAAVAVDRTGIAGVAGAVWLASQHPMPRIGRLDASQTSNNYSEWSAVLSRDSAGPTVGMALNAATGDLWVTMQGDPPLVMKIAGTNTIRRFRLAGAITPYGVATAQDDAAIVALPYRDALGIGNGLIKVPRNPVNGSVTATAWPTGGAPRAVVVDDSGYAWFTESAANRIGRLNLSTGTLVEWVLPNGTAPAGISVEGTSVCVASEGATNQPTGSVHCLDATSNQITSFVRATGDGFQLPQDLAINSVGEMFVAEQNGNSISLITSGARGAASITAVTPTTRSVAPVAIAINVEDVAAPERTYTIAPSLAVMTGADNGGGYVRFELSPVALTFPFETTGYAQPASVTQVLNDAGQGTGAVFFGEFFNGVFGRRAAARIGHLQLLVPPAITVSPFGLRFDAMSGAAAPDAQSVAITETNGQPISWRASKTAAWLTLTPAAGDAPSSMVVSIDHTSLAAGTYTDVITVDDGPDGAAPRTISVELTVAPPSPLISVSPASLSFSTLRGRVPATQAITVRNTGSASLSFTAGASTASGGSWLSVSPSTGTVAPGGTATLTAAVASGALATGTYTGTITVSDPSAPNSPQALSVSLTVNPAPTITLLPTTLTFTGSRWTTCNGVQSGSTVASQMLSVGNSGDGMLNYTAAASGGAWLSVAPASGTVASGAIGDLTVAVDIRNLARGTYNGIVMVADPNATNASQSADVTLTISPAGATLCVTPESVDFGTVGRNSTTASQILQILNVGDEPMGGWNATSTASRGTVNLSSSNGNAPDSVSVSVTTTAARGSQTGTITITAAGASNSVTINLTWTVN